MWADEISDCIHIQFTSNKYLLIKKKARDCTTCPSSPQRVCRWKNCWINLHSTKWKIPLKNRLSILIVFNIYADECVWHWAGKKFVCLCKIHSNWVSHAAKSHRNMPRKARRCTCEDFIHQMRSSLSLGAELKSGNMGQPTFQLCVCGMQWWQWLSRSTCRYMSRGHNSWGKHVFSPRWVRDWNIENVVRLPFSSLFEQFVQFSAKKGDCFDEKMVLEDYILWMFFDFFFAAFFLGHFGLTRINYKAYTAFTLLWRQKDKRTEIIMSYLSTDNSKFQAGNLTFLSECRIENVRKNSFH